MAGLSMDGGAALSTRRGLLTGWASADQGTGTATGTSGFQSAYDIIIVGSGMAGLSAAVAAGASVLMLEREATPGGTTALSPGHLWMPTAGTGRDATLRALARRARPERFDPNGATLGLDTGEYQGIAAFIDNADAALHSLLSGVSDLRYAPAVEAAPSSAASGRVHVPLGAGGKSLNGQDVVRMALASLMSRNVTFRARHRVTGLIRGKAGSVQGVEAVGEQGAVRFAARRAVIFASGGFGQNLRTLMDHQFVPAAGSAAASGSQGDFLDMASAAGFRLGNLPNAWRCEFVVNDVIGGQKPLLPVRTVPAGAIYVNTAGRRFIDEAVPPQDRAKAMYSWHTVQADYPRFAHFMIMDDVLAAQLSKGRQMLPNGINPRHLLRAKDADQLASLITQSLDRARAVVGVARLEPGFAGALRETLAERPWRGGVNALILVPGILDTNGGAVIDERSRVLNEDMSVVPRLYAAGNCAASCAVDAHWGEGASISLALVTGFLAGRSAAAETSLVQNEGLHA